MYSFLGLMAMSLTAPIGWQFKMSFWLNDRLGKRIEPIINSKVFAFIFCFNNIQLVAKHNSVYSNVKSKYKKMIWGICEFIYCTMRIRTKYILSKDFMVEGAQRKLEIESV